MNVNINVFILKYRIIYNKTHIFFLLTFLSDEVQWGTERRRVAVISEREVMWSIVKSKFRVFNWAKFQFVGL